MYKIGELSKLCNISVKTLRYYDAEGLLLPDKIDKFTGYRYYSASKLDDCYRIIALKELGFSLDEIRAQLTTDDNEKIAAALDAKLAELNLLIETTEKQLRKIESIQNNLTQGETKMFHIIIRATNEMRVAYLRKKYTDRAEALCEAERIAKALPKAIVGKRKIIINYEIEYRERNFDLAACVELLGPLPPNTPFQEKTVALDGSVATLVCQREELDDAYKAIIKHLDESDCKICGAYYEIYHDDDTTNTVELKVPVCERTARTIHRPEEIRMPFVDDPEVCGKWKMIDILPTREHFVYGRPKCGHLAWLDELYFIDGGQPYWGVAGWTKGCVYTYVDGGRLKNPYTLEQDGGHTLLFLQMKSTCDGGGLGFGAPEVWVYEKADDRHYASAEELRRCDNIDRPFVNDEAVRGFWKVRDFLICQENFAPEKQNWREEDLFALSVEFKKNGEFVLTTKNGTNSVTSVWTKGLVLNRREKTASAYEIRLIDGKEYLFWEWKSGDYSFGSDGRVYWYVFSRA